MGAIGRDEGILHHHVLAAGAAQPQGIPDPVDFEIAARDQEGAIVRRTTLGIGHQPAEERPLAMIDP